MARRTPLRVARALIEATRLTLRGEKHPAQARLERYPQTRAWIQETGTMLAAVEAAVREAGFDPAGLTLHIEGRDVKMSTILNGIRFHLSEEYPSLLASPSHYALLAIKATNLNDRYQVLRLEQAEPVPELVRASLHALADVLSRQPTENH
ncbi:MAG: hypothetical protein JNL34_11800 [Anaerolineae bacterium]|nr:hypothetical protein [Anaerolineae bacterium]